ncbi:hypothetical protein, variant [Verruconis gallopava]|nr:hypothetical protein, variant [Verruconis gallopava]KIV99791.1 hypothetical protein, variant [Verruconis gallopava]
MGTQPSLLILDDLHMIAGRQAESDTHGHHLIKHITELKGTKVQVVAAARRPIDVEQKLVSCFMKKIELPSPTQKSRRMILGHLAAGLADDAVLQYVAEKTHAFTAADLQALCFAAFESAELRSMKEKTNPQKSNSETLPAMSDQTYHLPSTLTREDFQNALRHIHPSLMDELYIEVPRVYWSDIAGSSHVKSKLWEAVELPLKHPDVVSRLNLRPSYGILLYGPPGCSKTMTAKALATESGLNFIAVKGPELVSKYVGESEYKIREIFRKAREASPSIIFFDEIDSIAPNREGGGGHEGLNTVATLLNEMDGVEDVARVLVLAATNRPDAIDPALLRPGRLGTTLYVGPPNREAILQILKMRTELMGSKPGDLELETIADKMSATGRFSGADVAALCDAAGMLCATEAVAAPNNVEVVNLQQRHLEQALEATEPTLDKRSLEFLQSWTVGKHL